LELRNPNGAASFGLRLSATTARGADAGYQQTYLFYQTQEVENTLFDTRGGDDIVRADPEFKFPFNDSEWGISPGDAQQRGFLVPLTLHGGAGNDQLYGGAYDDVIDGGDGADFIAGGGGNDRITGGPGPDLIA